MSWRGRGRKLKSGASNRQTFSGSSRRKGRCVEGGGGAISSTKPTTPPGAAFKPQIMSNGSSWHINIHLGRKHEVLILDFQSFFLIFHFNLVLTLLFGLVCLFFYMAATPPVVSSECLIQIRVPSGSAIRRKFPSDFTIQQVVTTLAAEMLECKSRPFFLRLVGAFGLSYLC